MITDDVLRLASFGLYPVRIHYPIFNEGGPVKCSCGNPACVPGPTSSIGKHPVNKAWGKSASTDPEVIADQFGNANWNVGIVLGICTGIPADQAVIDIEDDTEEGRDLAEALLGEYPTPSYSSGKSIHRIYRWSDKLPRKATWKYNGCEFRFGGDTLQTQSVAPPSVHHSGRSYEWLPGRSLDDIAIAELPSHVIEWICENWARDQSKNHSGPSSNEARKFHAPLGKIVHPGRHDALLTESNRLWREAYRLEGINGFEEQEIINRVWMKLAGANLLVCEPPKTDAEVQVIFKSSMAYMRSEILKEIEAREAEQREIAVPEDAAEDTFGNWLHQHGIRMQPDKRFAWNEESPERIDEWVCDWRMQYLTEGDEELIAVYIDGGDDPKPSIMTHKEFNSAQMFARRVAQDTKGRMCLDRSFTAWTWDTIWIGRPAAPKKPKGITRGLREYLLNKAEVVEHVQQDLADQVEDIVFGMAGDLSAIEAQLETWSENAGPFREGRLNLSPLGQLSDIRTPDMPVSGWYWMDGRIVLLVKNNEINQQYRKSYGSGVTNRKISEVMTGPKLRFIQKKINSGPMAGRWYLREKENLKE